MTSKFEPALTGWTAPPIHDAAFDQAASHDPAGFVSLNPQPLPPGPDPEPDDVWHHEQVHQSLFGGEHTALDLAHSVHPVVDYHG